MVDAALPPPRFCVEGYVAALEQVSPGVTALRIAVDGAPLAFAPGQYVALTLPEQQARDYSLSWRSTPGLLEFFVHDHGSGPSRFIAERLRVRDRVFFDGPFGTMCLGLSHDGPLLCIAFSTGIGPVMGIAQAAGELHPEREVQVYWGAANAADLFLIDEVAGALPPDSSLILAAEDGEPDSSVIRPGTALDAIMADFRNLEGWAVVAAGPPRMVEAATLLVESLGLPPEALHADAFFTQKDKQIPHGR